MTKFFSILLFIGAAVSPAYAMDPAGFSRGFDLASIRQEAAGIAVPQPAQPQADFSQAPSVLKEWTVLTFLNGANDRADLYSENLRAMSAVGTTENVNVVVEAAFKMENRSLVQRMLVLPGDGKEINSEVYKTWINRDMGDWRNAADFFKWGKAKFPAKRYILIIQNHGGGFVDETSVPKPGDKGISYDSVNHSYIKVPELPLLLKEAGGADIFIMNACEMQMAEVAYEIGTNAGVIIASEETDSSLYYQHKERLVYLNANPQASAEKIAAAFVAMRKKMLTPGNTYYSEVFTSTITVDSSDKNTLSAIRTSELAGLPSALDAWTSVVMAANEPEALKFAIASAIRFGVQTPSGQPFSRFADLGDFAARIWTASKKQEVKDATAELLSFISNKLVIANSAMNSNANGTDYGKSVRGIAIKMIPLTPVNQSVLSLNYTVVVDTKYEDLLLSKESQWDEFLKWAGNIYYQPR